MTTADAPKTAPSFIPGAALLGCAAVLFILLLHPRIGIRDGDGSAYLLGARALHAGQGYRDLTGASFGRWPPGYSFLLSLFPNPEWAALAINYLAFGTVIGLLYFLSRRLGWPWHAGLGLAVAFGSGFFRLLANQVTPDILTYALFLLGLALAVHGGSRLAPSLIWAALGSIKLVAGTFLPPALVADRWVHRQSWKALARTYLPAAVVAAICIGGSIALDLFGGQTWSLNAPSQAPEVLSGSLRTFGRALPRLFLFGWHGSVANAFAMIALWVCLLLAAAALLTLIPVAAPASRWLRIYGVAFFGCAALLAPVSEYGPVPRLVGYGLLVLILSCRPRQWASGLWLAYGTASLVAGAVNGVTVSTTGLLDARYVALGTEFRSYYTGSDPVVTNARYVLDLHAGIPGRMVRDWRDVKDSRKLLWVTPQATTESRLVPELPRPGVEWCEERRFTAGILFSRCDTQ